MHNFKNLKVWQKAVELAVKINDITSGFPADEKFGLTSQIRRAGVSIPSNIAEGTAKSSSKAFANSLEISLGESYELETQIIICQKVGLIKTEKSDELEKEIIEIQKMVLGLKSSLNINISGGPLGS